MDILITLLEIKNLKKKHFSSCKMWTQSVQPFLRVSDTNRQWFQLLNLKISRKLSLETICNKRTNDDEKSIFMGSRILVK